MLNKSRACQCARPGKELDPGDERGANQFVVVGRCGMARLGIRALPGCHRNRQWFLHVDQGNTADGARRLAKDLAVTMAIGHDRGIGDGNHRSLGRFLIQRLRINTCRQGERGQHGKYRQYEHP